MSHADVIRELAERWNAGDWDGVLDLYADDAVMVSGPDWPEQVTWRGREGIRSNMEDWRSVWETAKIDMGIVETYGDKVIGTGAWVMRGRTSGADASSPIVILCSFRHGKIASLEWFTDHDAAVAAARGT